MHSLGNRTIAANISLEILLRKKHGMKIRGFSVYSFLLLLHVVLQMTASDLNIFLSGL